MPREGMNPLLVSRVVGDVLDPFTPTTELRVYCDGRILCDGARLRPSQIVTCPRVEIGSRQDNHTLYTLVSPVNCMPLVMVDADAPSPGNPYLREYLHWLVTDIPGGSAAGSGNEMVGYEGPQPSMGIHRFAVVLFQQPAGRLNMDAPEWRQNFNIRQFSQLYSLGSPVAALYFNCNREGGTGGRRPR